MAELVVELFSEEIPARMQVPMAEKLRQHIDDQLNKLNLFNTGVKTYVTPRRLVLTVEGLSLTQENTMVEKKGPRTDAPEKAIEGFLRSTGLTMDQLTKRELDKGEFYFAIYKQEGQKTKDVLTNLLEDTIQSITWPKSMRWGNHDIRWVRPLSNILAVFGNEVLPLKFGHLSSNNISKGHRFMAPDEFEVDDFKKLKSELKNRKVILDTEERKEIILTEARRIAEENGLKLLEDAGLATEVAGLVEWPVVLFGRIDKEFMDVPEEVLISSIRTHQKYFCLRDNQGNLAPYFIIISNVETDDGGKEIIAGNERVLRARLADAQFFWNQDIRNPFEECNEKLERVIFHAKLGTIADKTKRISVLSKFLAVWIPHAKLDDVARAAELCKSDLVTEMVGEFPDLQGIMGCHYSNNSDERPQVSLAIKEHYSPLGPNDACPRMPISIAVALADKIDTLAGLFAIDEKPTGSKDPYALRRAALGVIRLILENKLSIPLRILFSHALKQYPKSLFKQIEDIDKNVEGESKKKLLKKRKRKKNIKIDDVVADLLKFFEERLKALLKSENIRHDLITAVFEEGKEDDFLRLVQRVEALDKFLKSDDGENLLSAYVRAANIVRIEEKKDDTVFKGMPSKILFQQEEEEELFKHLLQVKPLIRISLKENSFESAMSLLANMRESIDSFFENVTVNCDDQDVRKNRLKILAKLQDLFDEVADFSLIEG